MGKTFRKREREALKKAPKGIGQKFAEECALQRYLLRFAVERQHEKVAKALATRDAKRGVRAL